MALRSSLTKSPAPRRIARASISAVQLWSAILNSATTPSAKRRAPWLQSDRCAHTLGLHEEAVSGGDPGTINCPSLQRAVSHCAARGSAGAIRHKSSAAGHKPKRNITRAASAAVCVRHGANRCACCRTDRRNPDRALCCADLGHLIYRVGIARRHKGVIQRIDPRHQLLRLPAQIGSDAMASANDSVSHLNMIAMNGNAPANGHQFPRAPASNLPRCHSP